MFQVTDIQFLDYNDLIIAPIYLIIILIFAYAYRSLALRNSLIKRYFISGMMAKIIGGLTLGAVYGFYYKGGDTFYYFYDSKTFNNSLSQGFNLFFKLLLLPANKSTPATYDSTWWLTFFHDPPGWMADKIFGIISIFSFHSYPVMAIIASVLSFTGVWALYSSFADLYPQLSKPIAYCVLFVPSVFFWGSGILKDSITFGCLGWITYCSYSIFFKRRNIFRNSVILFITGYIAMQIKAYIVISFLPALLFWIFLTYRSRIKNKFLRVISGPLVFLSSMVFGYFLVTQLGNEFAQFSLSNVLTTAQTYQEWHSFLAQNDKASGYTLGNVSGSWQSIVLAFPAAVNVTLFRPYLWQAHSITMLVSAVESTFILAFTIYIFLKNGFRRPLTLIITNPTVFFCLFFAITFAFSVGFTAYNYGALVRYKIPCISFYLVALVIINSITAEQRQEIQEEKDLQRRNILAKNSQLQGLEETV